MLRRFAGESGTIHRGLSCLLALTIGLLGIVTIAFAPAANASVLDGAITSVTLVDNDANGDNNTSTTTANGTPLVSLTYNIPPSGKSGDTFTLKLPPELVSTVVPGPLMDPDCVPPPGAPADYCVVATVTLDKTTGTYTFTLTTYADDHDTIRGTAYFEVGIAKSWRDEVIGAPGPVRKDLVFETPGQNFTIPFSVLPTPTSQVHVNAQKTGYFQDTQDQGMTNPVGALRWRIQSPDGPFTSVTFTDNVPPGSTIDCASITVMLVKGYDATGYPNAEEPVPAANITWLTPCSPTGFSLRVDMAVNGPTADLPAQLVRVKFNGTTVDPSPSAEFLNTAQVTLNDGRRWNVSADVERAEAGGDGGGLKRVSVGDYVWVDANRDGIQDAVERGIPGVVLVLTGPDGQPVTDVNGAPVVPLTTDASGLYVFRSLPTLPAGQHYTVTIDQAASAAALAPYVPTITGQGTRATDSSTWSAESGDLTVHRAADLTLDFGFVKPAVSVGDYVWLDDDKDGIQDAVESGIRGVILTLTGPNGQPVIDVNGNPVAPTTTLPDGSYNFPDLPILPPGQSYTVTIDPTSPPLAGLVATQTDQGTRATDSSTGSATSGDLTSDGDRDDTLDFGFYPQPKVSVGNYVWVDTDKDGIQDVGEPGIESVTLTITGPNGQPVTDVNGDPVGPTLTGPNGAYSFADLPVLQAGQSYTVTIDQTSPALAPYVPTRENAGDRATDSSTGSASSTGLTADGQFDDTLDFGFYPPVVSVGDYVWLDSDKDGVQDLGELGIEGVVLALLGPDGLPLTDADGNPMTATTDQDGAYSFDDLPVLDVGESYTVTIDNTQAALAPYVPTTTGAGTPATDSSTGSATSGDLTADGDRDSTLDFGFFPPSVSVGDYVWVDIDKDGVQDVGEPGIPNVELTLTGPDGQTVVDINGDPVRPVTTKPDGRYDFPDLPILLPGQSYTVTIDPDSPALEGYLPTTPGQGTPATDSSTDFAESGDLTTDGDRDDTLDFGFYPPSVSVGDYVWVDSNGNGVQNPGEPGISGVLLTITGPDGKPVVDVFGNPVEATLTDGNGAYTFENLPVLPPGEHYTVTIDQTSPALAAYVPTQSGAGTPATDSSTGSATSGDLTDDGDRDNTLDFGFVPPRVSVGDFVWVDTNGNGSQDAGEPGIPGVSMTLTGPDGKPVIDVFGNPVTPVVTGPNGDYTFVDLPVLPAGQHYTVTIDITSPALAAYLPTTANVGNSATDSSTGSATSGDLTDDGDRDSTLDFGFVPPKPAVDIEKWSTADGPVAGDFDQAPGKALDGQPVSVTFTITNTGNEPLKDIVVKDTTNAGPALTNVSCDFSKLGGPATGTTWSGPFAVGASFLCAGELPAADGEVQHSDTASVTGTGLASGTNVRDQDDWHGQTQLVISVTTTNPSVDIEKWSTIDGPVDGDFDTAPGKPLTFQQPESISFTITNDGDEPLVDVTVADTTTNGADLQDLSCDFSQLGGPKSGTAWKGPFAVGDSFICTAELPGLQVRDQHSDTATVTATGQDSGQQVGDQDEWHGMVHEAVLDAFLEIETTTTGDTPASLPNTGGPSSALLAGGLAAVVTGLLVLGFSRRSRRRTERG